MENSNLNIPTQPTMPPEVSGDSSKALWWLIGGIIVTVILIVGFYLWQSSRQPSYNVPQTQPSKLQSAAPKQQENLESALNSLNVESKVEGDFASVDEDLQQL